MGRGQEPPPPASARPRVLLLCTPCMGHLIPFAELARRLVADHGLAATLLFAAATSPPSEQYLALAAAVPDGVDLVALPAPPPDALPPSAPVPERAVHAVVSSVPRVRGIARALAAAAPLAALVVDMISVPVRGVAEDLGIPCYMFFTSPWMALSLLLHLPELDATRTGEHRDATEPIRLPGCVPIHAHEVLESMLADRNSDTYAGFLSIAKGAARVDGILVNTFLELEPAVGHCTDGLKLPVHAVGPLVWSRAVGMDRDHRCLSWLDRQPHGSVVYCRSGVAARLRGSRPLSWRWGWSLVSTDSFGPSRGQMKIREAGHSSEPGKAKAKAKAKTKTKTPHWIFCLRVSLRGPEGWGFWCSPGPHKQRCSATPPSAAS